MLRMPSIQPPSDARTIVSAGRVPWWITEEMNSHDHSGDFPTPNALPIGNQPRFTEKTVIASRPSQKYGMVLRNVVSGISRSSLLPRLQPMNAPPTVPTAKAITVAMPTSPMVHGSAPEITSDTGRRPCDSEMPRSPRSRRAQ